MRAFAELNKTEATDNDVFKVLKVNKCQLRIMSKLKSFSEIKGKKYFLRQKLSLPPAKHIICVRYKTIIKITCRFKK